MWMKRKNGRCISQGFTCEMVESYVRYINGQLYHDYLATGPAEYMAAIFRKLTDSDEAAMLLALEFYGPMFLLYSVYDGANEKERIAPILSAHIDSFIAKVESGYRMMR